MSDERSESARITPERPGARLGARLGPRPAVRAALRSAPWIAIVALTAVVQFVRAAPIDGVVFGVVAVALLADAAGIIPRFGPIARPGIVPVLIAALAVALLLTLTPRHGVVDGIVTAGAGAAALLAAWAGVGPGHETARGPRPGDAAALRRTAILWAAVGVATCAWELTSFVFGRMQPELKAQHPAISDLLDPALDQLWLRALFVIGWLALGIALLSRGGRR
jgi:hypothetical protein